MTVISSDPCAAHQEPVLTIRQAKGIDGPAIAELRALWSTGAAPTREFTGLMRTWLEAEGESRITLIASTRDDDVGMISLLEYRGMPEPGGSQSRWGYVGDLFVTEASRGHGVGTALIKETMAIADERAYERMLVSPTAAALPLFDRLGFVMLDELGPEGIILWRQNPTASALIEKRQGARRL
jgi:GNAT superfamily N-acetyltransferase